jgi:hypothetical protein
MPEFFISSELDLQKLFNELKQQKLPFTVNLIKGDSRSLAQNRLQRMWLNEIADYTGSSPEEIRGWCKLHLGIPIMREHEGFRKAWASNIKKGGLNYDQKIALMMEPLDLPVTRLMTTEQKTRYLDQMWLHFTEKVGVTLTNPEDRLYKAMIASRRKEAA